MQPAETLCFDDLEPFLLLKNGNFLYKVPFRGGWAVIKVYYGSRGVLGNLYKSFENVTFAGQTSYQPRTRLRVERECLEVWRKHGFRVYNTHDDVVVEAPNCPADGYTVFEYRTGPKLFEYLGDERIALDTRFATYRRFLLEWSQRHELAIAEHEPRLVHENGDGKHVLVLEEGFLWFDFEIVWRDPARVAEQVSHEIIQYLWQISKSIPAEIRERLLDETVANYPSQQRLRDACAYFLAHPRPLHRLARFLDRNLRARARKATSKYNLADRLQRKLEPR